MFLQLLTKNKLILVACLCFIGTFFIIEADAQRRRAASGGNRAAIVVDERLAVLRDAPSLNARVLQRLGRGRSVTILASKRGTDGITFHRVAVSRRTRGWLQSDAVVTPNRVGDDERLLRLARGSVDFDRLARASLMNEMFPRSPLRVQALMLIGEEAEKSATKLSREARRRLDEKEMTAGGAPRASYFLNYNGLDRYSRLGIAFIYDEAAKAFRYDGATWRELARRYPNSTEAETARAKLKTLSSGVSQ